MLEMKTNKTIEGCVRTSFAGQIKEVSSSVEKARPSGICSGPGNASPQQFSNIAFGFKFREDIALLGSSSKLQSTFP